ncbi:MAG: tetratricopeptide repeat protein [Planctomycetota bacterium]
MKPSATDTKPSPKPSSKPSPEPSSKPRPSVDTPTDLGKPKSPERGASDASKPAVGTKPIAPDPTTTVTRESTATDIKVPTAAPIGKKPERFVDDEVFGVPVKGDGATRGTGSRDPRADGAAGAGVAVGDVIANGSNIDQTVVINNNTYNTYTENIYDANGWNPYGHGSSAGPCHTWERYDCSDGISIAIGFGGGFSFGFFYGSSCAPLCTSWSNPWWCGYASSWSCGPSWYACRPWYSWCHRPWWRDWNSCAYWTSSWCTPCPRPWWTPCYTYTPIVYTPYAYTQVVYQPVVVQAPPPLPAPATLWSYLADGYDDDAAEGFAVLAVADPNEGVWFAAQGLALAFRGDEARGADLLRDAFLADPSAMTRIDRSPRLATRIEALERVLSPFANGAPASVDALLVIAACQAARGDLAQAYFTATTAQAEGDRSAGTASFVAWLHGELRRKI